MSTFLMQRKIALLIKFLKQELQPEHRSELGDADLAKLLNEAQKHPTQFLFTGARVNELLHGKRRLNPSKEAAVMVAIQELISASTRLTIDVSKDLPQWIEDQCAPQLREALREAPASVMAQGETLGDRLLLLSGAWCFFWVVLPARAASAPLIFRFGLIFRPASSNHMSVVMVSRHSEWRGAAYINGNYLHIYLRDVADTKSASFITNLPMKRQRKLSGVGITVEPQWQVLPHPALISFVCFGEKWDASTEGDHDLAESVDRVVGAGGAISETDVESVRRGFYKEYTSVEEFAREYPQLLEYMKNHRINGESGFPLHFLHLAFS